MIEYIQGMIERESDFKVVFWLGIIDFKKLVYYLKQKA